MVYAGCRLGVDAAMFSGTGKPDWGTTKYRGAAKAYCYCRTAGAAKAMTVSGLTDLAFWITQCKSWTGICMTTEIDGFGWLAVKTWYYCWPRLRLVWRLLKDIIFDYLELLIFSVKPLIIDFAACIIWISKTILSTSHNLSQCQKKSEFMHLSNFSF